MRVYSILVRAWLLTLSCLEGDQYYMYDHEYAFSCFFVVEDHHRIHFNRTLSFPHAHMTGTYPLQPSALNHNKGMLLSAWPHKTLSLPRALLIPVPPPHSLPFSLINGSLSCFFLLFIVYVIFHTIIFCLVVPRLYCLLPYADFYQAEREAALDLSPACCSPKSQASSPSLLSLTPENASDKGLDLTLPNATRRWQASMEELRKQSHISLQQIMNLSFAQTASSNNQVIYRGYVHLHSQSSCSIKLLHVSTWQRYPFGP